MIKFRCRECGVLNEVNLGRVLGSHTSPKKAAAARRNAKKGGRPRKDKSK